MWGLKEVRFRILGLVGKGYFSSEASGMRTLDVFYVSKTARARLHHYCGLILKSVLYNILLRTRTRLECVRSGITREDADISLDVFDSESIEMDGVTRKSV